VVAAQRNSGGCAHAGQAAQTVAKDRAFHPIRSYLGSIRWDGVERLDSWPSTYLGVEDTAYVRAVGARWLISAVPEFISPASKRTVVSFWKVRKALANPAP